MGGLQVREYYKALSPEQKLLFAIIKQACEEKDKKWLKGEICCLYLKFLPKRSKRL